MRENFVKSKLKAKDFSIGTMVFECNSPGIPGILDQTGLDFVIYDMEHSGFGMETIRQLISYNRGLRMLPFVRVPDSQYFHIARVLDAGAMGVMIPMVENREQASRIIEASKYYPTGKRGTAFCIAHDDFSLGDTADKIQRANEETLIIALIETEEGINHVEEIVSTDGIDVAWVGHFDLSQSMGIPGQVEHPRVIAALERVAEVCNKYGKTAGRLVPDSESAIRWMEKGYRCLSYSGDIWIMQNTILKALSDIKSHIYNENREAPL